jgi:hypothetical protein
MALTPEQRQAAANALDLEKAWAIVNYDEANRVFFRHPIEKRLIEINLPSWLETVRRKIVSGEYSPRGSILCEKPKANNLVRHGQILSKEDQLVYTALVGSEIDRFRNALLWSQEKIDFSYPLARKADNPIWFTPSYQGWTKFRESSLRKIKAGAGFVVVTDLSGYYDHIAINPLLSDLREIGFRNETLDLLSGCLRRWAPPSMKGIPQGYSPSDLLGKLYLNSIDHKLKDMGYSHVRYVDDIRIFCQTRAEAKEAIIVLSRMLRDRGLSLQSSKTEILDAGEARRRIEGAIPAIQEIAHGLVIQVKDMEGVDPDYISAQVVDAILKSHPDAIPPEALEKAFKEKIIEMGDGFDRSFFHYLIRRLGQLGNRFALEYCRNLLIAHPDETEDLLLYFERVSFVNEEADEFICESLIAAEAVYPYQKYEILAWVLETFSRISERMLSIARDVSFDNNQPAFLRAYSRELLGKFGSPADLDRLLSVYAESQGGLQESEIMYGIRRMEKGKRNDFYGRVRNTGDFNNRAAQLSGA